MRNKYEVRGDVTAILVKHRGIEFESLIDTEDFIIADSNPNTWHAKETRKNGDLYIKSSIIKDRVYKALILHRMILGNPEGLVVDHINHNTLDNRRGNLRAVSNQMNLMNRKGATRVSKSGYRGVYWNPQTNAWVSQIKIDGVLTRIGSFKTKLDAADSVHKTLLELGLAV